MHETMKRLYAAAKEIKNIEGRGAQSELGRLFNKSPQVIKNWEERGMSHKGMIEAEKKLGISLAWLQDGEGTMLPPEPRYDNVRPTALPIRAIPLISWVQAGNWQSVELYDEDDRETVYATSRVSANAYALRVQGDSMQPEFTEGDIVIIDPDAEQRAGCFVVALHDGETTLKKLLFDGSRAVLKPLNPEYKTLYLQQEGDRILGVVKEKVKRY